MERILLVDDEENILSGYKRTLRGRFQIDTAISGPAALQLIEEKGAYPVVVSDMRMPEMSGVEFLSRVKKAHPHTVRILLTGNTDQETAVKAINEGDVFRFLNKPCTPDVLSATLDTAVEHHRLVTAELDLLQNTLQSSIEVLVELLSLVRPDALGQTMRVKKLIQKINTGFDAGIESWELETAGLLSQLGYTTLSKNLVEKAQAGQNLDPTERRKLQDAVELAVTLIGRIPRLKGVAQIIRYQDKAFDGSGMPKDSVKGESIPLGARILKCALDFDRLLTGALSNQEALATMKSNSAHYDKNVLQKLIESFQGEVESVVKVKSIASLTSSMILAEDVITMSGLLLAPKGLEASEAVRAHLKRFLESGQIADRVRVTETQ